MKKGLLISGGVVLVAAAFILGGALMGSHDAPAPAAAGSAEQIWTCSMHPSVRLPQPGKCPICDMPLIPVVASSADGTIPMLALGEHALSMAAVETEPVGRRTLEKEIRAIGRVAPNETALATVTSRVAGYIERLFVDATGIRVEKDDHLVEIYSPELVSTQEELLVALDSKVSGALVEAAKRKLRRWGVAEHQIDELARTRKVTERITIHSPQAGTVIEKAVVEGSSVQVGDVLYRLADLGSVWVNLEIYEYEIAWVQPGEKAICTAEAWPGHEFSGTVTFVSPVLDETTRTVRVRVVLPNRDGRLKPGMFVSAALRVRLRADGRAAPTTSAGKWTCPMHPEVIQDLSGPCPVCGMPLRQFPEAAAAKPEDLRVLAVPASAVLDSGARRVVYVERARGRFQPVLVELGPRAGDWFVVMKGLAEGDRVARRGAFLLDSEAQIQGLTSLIEGRATGHEGHAPDPARHEGSDQEGSEHR